MLWTEKLLRSIPFPGLKSGWLADPANGATWWNDIRLANFSPLQVKNCVLYLDPRESDGITLMDATLVAGTDFSNAAWTKTATVIANDDGIGDRITTTTGSGTQFVDQNPANVGLNSTACPPIRFTWRFKPGTTTWVMIDHSTGTTRTIWFNVATGTQGTKPAQITNVSISAPDANGYRTYSYDITATNGAFGCTFRGVGADNGATNPGNGTYFWAQSVAISQPRVSAIDNLVTGVEFAQATANNQPGYETGGLNGRPSLRSYVPGSAAQYLQSADAAALAIFTGDDTPWTFFAVIQPRHTIATESNTVFSAYSGSQDNLTGFLQDNGGIGPWRIDRRDGAGLTANTSSTHGGTGVPRILEAWFTGSQTFLTLDGATPNPNGAANNRAAQSPTAMRLLAYGTAAGSSASLGQVAAYSRVLTAEERSYVRQGLGLAYNIPVAA